MALNPTILEHIKDAFRTSTAGCCETCACGRVFYDICNSWSWEEGELEELEADAEATSLPYSVELLNLQGGLYVIDCNCWLGLAEKIAGFLLSNRYAIGEFYKLEKRRREIDAKSIPVIEIEPAGLAVINKRKVVLTD